MNEPTVSIIMSTYNDDPYIKEAIDSVLQQSFSNWEFIIINDASIDKTEDIINRYAQKDKRVKNFTNKKNNGLATNLITGVKLSKGKYIARIDGDDKWIDKNKLKKQIEFLEKNPDYGLVGCWAYIVDREGNTTLATKNPNTDDEIRNYILIENCFFHSSVIIRKTIFEKTGGYDASLKTTEDYHLWLKIGLTSKMYNIPEYMINYRVNPNGINSTKYAFQLKETIELVKKFNNYYPNYRTGIFLWYLRKYVPKEIKTFTSNILKNKYAIEGSRQIKKAILNFHS